jgi:nucleoside-diphosphate-sugar epimerase
MRKKRVIILGSGGFISSNIEKELTKKNIEVLSFSRTKLDLSKYNNANVLKKIIRKNDYIFFAAAKAPVKNIDMLIYNLKMLKIISGSIIKDKIKKFVYLSSDAVYADTKKKITEKSIVAPNSLHGQMHLIREDYLQNIFQEKMCIIRPTLVFGPDDPHNGYGPNKFARDIKNRNTINLFGKGEERRDHIFINDLSHLVSRLIINNFYGNINLATGQVHSFYSIAKKIISIYGKNSKIKFIKRNGPMPHLGLRSFKISKLKKLFPKYKINSSLENINDNFHRY